MAPYSLIHSKRIATARSNKALVPAQPLTGLKSLPVDAQDVLNSANTQLDKALQRNSLRSLNGIVEDLSQWMASNLHTLDNGKLIVFIRHLSKVFEKLDAFLERDSDRANEEITRLRESLYTSLTAHNRVVPLIPAITFNEMNASRALHELLGKHAAHVIASNNQGKLQALAARNIDTTTGITGFVTPRSEGSEPVFPLTDFYQLNRLFAGTSPHIFKLLGETGQKSVGTALAKAVLQEFSTPVLLSQISCPPPSLRRYSSGTQTLNPMAEDLDVSLHSVHSDSGEEKLNDPKQVAHHNASSIQLFTAIGNSIGDFISPDSPLIQEFGTALVAEFTKQLAEKKEKAIFEDTQKLVRFTTAQQGLIGHPLHDQLIRSTLECIKVAMDTIERTLDRTRFSLRSPYTGVLLTIWVDTSLSQIAGEPSASKAATMTDAFIDTITKDNYWEVDSLLRRPVRINALPENDSESEFEGDPAPVSQTPLQRKMMDRAATIIFELQIKERSDALDALTSLATWHTDTKPATMRDWLDQIGTPISGEAPHFLALRNVAKALTVVPTQNQSPVEKHRVFMDRETAGNLITQELRKSSSLDEANAAKAIALPLLWMIYVLEPILTYPDCHVAGFMSQASPLLPKPSLWHRKGYKEITGIRDFNQSSYKGNDLIKPLYLEPEKPLANGDNGAISRQVVASSISPKTIGGNLYFLAHVLFKDHEKQGQSTAIQTFTKTLLEGIFQITTGQTGPIPKIQALRKLVIDQLRKTPEYEHRIKWIEKCLIQIEDGIVTHMMTQITGLSSSPLTKIEEIGHESEEERQLIDAANRQIEISIALPYLYPAQTLNNELAARGLNAPLSTSVVESFSRTARRDGFRIQTDQDQLSEFGDHAIVTIDRDLESTITDLYLGNLPNNFPQRVTPSLSTLIARSVGERQINADLVPTPELQITVETEIIRAIRAYVASRGISRQAQHRLFLNLMRIDLQQFIALALDNPLIKWITKIYTEDTPEDLAALEGLLIQQDKLRYEYRINPNVGLDTEEAVDIAQLRESIRTNTNLEALVAANKIQKVLVASTNENFEELKRRRLIVGPRNAIKINSSLFNDIPDTARIKQTVNESFVGFDGINTFITRAVCIAIQSEARPIDSRVTDALALFDSREIIPEAKLPPLMGISFLDYAFGNIVSRINAIGRCVPADTTTLNNLMTFGVSAVKATKDDPAKYHSEVQAAVLSILTSIDILKPFLPTTHNNIKDTIDEFESQILRLSVANSSRKKEVVGLLESNRKVRENKAAWQLLASLKDTMEYIYVVTDKLEGSINGLKGTKIELRDITLVRASANQEYDADTDYKACARIAEKWLESDTPLTNPSLHKLETYIMQQLEAQIRDVVDKINRCHIPSAHFRRASALNSLFGKLYDNVNSVIVEALQKCKNRLIETAAAKTTRGEDVTQDNAWIEGLTKYLEPDEQVEA